MEAQVLQLPIFSEEPEECDLPTPGLELAASLPVDFDGLSDDELLEAAAAARRLTSWAQARELAAIAELSRRREHAEQDGDPDYRILCAHESVCQEVSAALAVTDQAAATLVDLADRLSSDLPETRQALETGHIDLPKARVISELSEGLAPELAESLEARILPTADTKTTGQLRARIRRIIHRLAPEHLRQRKREAVRERRLEVWDDITTGTANLAVTGLDPAAAHGIFNKITAAARGMRADGDTRTLHQARADLAQQLLQGNDLPGALHTLLTQEPNSPAVVTQAAPEPCSEPCGTSDAVAAVLAR